MKAKFRPIPQLTPGDIARLTSKAGREGECWPWQGSKLVTGYGVTYVSGSRANLLAHRVAYFQATGDDPGPLDIDHTCHNRSCVNPKHLRAVTHKVNSENRAGTSANNTSGVRGVHWDKSRNAWMARVKHNGVAYNLGRFSSLSEAECKVVEARARFFGV